MLKVIELLIESEILVAWLPKRCLVFLEELQGAVQTRFLAGVDQRHAGQRIGEHRECVRKVAEPFEFRAFPGVQVMVCDHVHQISVFRILLLLDVEKPEDVRGMFLGEFLTLPSVPLKVIARLWPRFR